MHVHVRQDPCCVSFEGCPSPLEEAGPDEVPTQLWVQWGRNLKRACAGGVMAKQHAILKSKLAELRCAIVTPRIGRDKRHPALLVPLAPVPAPSNATQASVSADSGLAARTQLCVLFLSSFCYFLTDVMICRVQQIPRENFVALLDRMFSDWNASGTYWSVPLHMQRRWQAANCSPTQITAN